MRYTSTRATSVYAIFLRATFSRAIDAFTSKRAYPRRSHLNQPSLQRQNSQRQNSQRQNSQRQSAAQINLAPVLIKTFSADAAILLSGWILGVLASWLVSTIAVRYERTALLLPPQWLTFAVVLLLPCVWLAADVAKALSYPQALPFAGLSSALKKVYAARLHWLLLTFCFTATLMLLCWLTTEMLLVSKLFVSAVMAIALYALDQKLQSRRRSLIISSLLFFGLLIISQVGITAQLTTNFVADKLSPLNLLNELGFDKQKREFPIVDEI